MQNRQGSARFARTLRLRQRPAEVGARQPSGRRATSVAGEAPRGPSQSVGWAECCERSHSRRSSEQRRACRPLFHVKHLGRRHRAPVLRIRRIGGKMFHVKHEADSPLSPASIAEAVFAAGVACDETAAEAIARHARLVLDHNSRINLTRIVEPSAVLSRHIVDCLAWLALTDLPVGPGLDLGSGAGYPGIPVAAVTCMEMTLVESVKKKAAFLEEVVAELALDATVFAGRSEDLAKAQRQRFGSVMARAVSSLPSLVEMSAPLLHAGGRLFALKGIPPDDEIEQADFAAQVCGMQRVGTRRYELTSSGEQRCLVIYERRREATISLPRQAGMAHRQPLGKRT